MRRILAASLLLVPSLFPAAALASQTVNDASASAQVRPLSTGVTSPRIIRTVNVIATPELIQALPSDTEVVLKLNVDEQGMAQNVEVVKSVNKKLDDRVVAAVREFRWRPATLDKQAIPVDLTLNVNVKH